jgi:hypothetical protein
MNYQTRTMAPDFLPPIHRPNMPLVARPAINGSQKGMWPALPRERDGCLVRFTRACVGCGGERSTWYDEPGEPGVHVPCGGAILLQKWNTSNQRLIYICPQLACMLVI